MTAREQKTRDRLAWLAGFVARHGHGPTLGELARGWGVRADGTVRNTLHLLERRGWIERTPNISRAIVVTGRGEAVLRGDADEHAPKSERQWGRSTTSHARELVQMAGLRWSTTLWVASLLDVRPSAVPEAVVAACMPVMRRWASDGAPVSVGPQLERLTRDFESRRVPVAA